MKRNEFKLLLEDWKKNFIVESEIPEVSDEEIAQDYFDYFDKDGSFDRMDSESNSLYSSGEIDAMSDNSGIYSMPSYDTDSKGKDVVLYPGEESLDSDEIRADYSSIGGHSDETMLDDDLLSNDDHDF